MEQSNGTPQQTTDTEGQPHRHAKIITAYWTIDDRVHWRYSTRNLSVEEDMNVQVRFFIVIKDTPIPQKGEAVRKLLGKIRKSEVPWIIPGAMGWTFDLDHMKGEFPELQELPWFVGRAVVEPEFEVTGERENITRGTYYETAVVFGGLM